ncbi:hypothetical protein ADIMK_0817 [Marinobacterium lacunae]|uniref:DUF2164 domain-containing protein n=1 Tax=Marinobacterium lacunae TaxID=1232683 RepID=A0A081G2W0_9GAMM|nr:DUF2164 domain-containing protein [Marinobacterium lacunae]KEA65115.1 hypothetical protein ADIMK_0817 [Marinobacterium lacunae]MBR9884874.1 DUF2164 domain-containing protein [Oceanospirillales bacterium]
MSIIKFSREEQALIVEQIQQYFSEELDQELGGFDAQFLLDFIGDVIGPYFYNRGLYDALAMLETRMENLSESIYELEKTTAFKRG